MSFIINYTKLTELVSKFRYLQIFTKKSCFTAKKVKHENVLSGVSDQRFTYLEEGKVLSLVNPHASNVRSNG